MSELPARRRPLNLENFAVHITVAPRGFIPRELASALEAFAPQGRPKIPRFEHSLHRPGKVFDAGRAEIFGGVPGYFRQRGGARTDYRSPTGHGLEDRQTKP